MLVSKKTSKTNFSGIFLHWIKLWHLSSVTILVWLQNCQWLESTCCFWLSENVTFVEEIASANFLILKSIQIRGQTVLMSTSSLSHSTPARLYLHFMLHSWADRRLLLGYCVLMCYCIPTIEKKYWLFFTSLSLHQSLREVAIFVLMLLIPEALERKMEKKTKIKNNL